MKCIFRPVGKVDFSSNTMADPSFEFYDQSLLDDVHRGNPDVHEFFRLLAVCHTVMPVEDKEKGKTKRLYRQLISAVLQCWKYRFSSDPRSQATLGLVSTWMGDSFQDVTGLWL